MSYLNGFKFWRHFNAQCHKAYLTLPVTSSNADWLEILLREISSKILMK